jgi:hypothetical protein
MTTDGSYPLPRYLHLQGASAVEKEQQAVASLIAEIGTLELLSAKEKGKFAKWRSTQEAQLIERSSSVAAENPHQAAALSQLLVQVLLPGFDVEASGEEALLVLFDLTERCKALLATKLPPGSDLEAHLATFMLESDSRKLLKQRAQLAGECAKGILQRQPPSPVLPLSGQLTALLSKMVASQLFAVSELSALEQWLAEVPISLYDALKNNEECKFTACDALCLLLDAVVHPSMRAVRKPPAMEQLAFMEQELLGILGQALPHGREVGEYIAENKKFAAEYALYKGKLALTSEGYRQAMTLLANSANSCDEGILKQHKEATALLQEASRHRQATAASLNGKSDAVTANVEAVLQQLYSQTAALENSASGLQAYHHYFSHMTANCQRTLETIKL